MKGVNAAEEVCPGIKDEILTGVIETSIPEIVGLEKIPLEERKTAVECLRAPKEKRKAKEIARKIEEAFSDEVIDFINSMNFNDDQSAKERYEFLIQNKLHSKLN